MKNQKQFLIGAITLAILIPQVTFAAWWNPFTWNIPFFNKAPKAQIQQVQLIQNATTTPNINAKTSDTTKKEAAKPSAAPLISINKTTNKISATTLSNSQIIKKVKPAVVYIETDAGTGSGMIISSDGFILTNAHVVVNSTTANITLSSGNIYLASVVGRDENVDLAVLKVNAQNLVKVDFGDSNTAEQGDEVFTLGYPFGIKGDVSFKEGTISRKIIDGANAYIETSAEIHPGNSGGPLVNTEGNVVGVNSASFGQSIKGIAVGETIKFAIPINIAKNLIPELKAGLRVIAPKTETPVTGDPFQTEDSNLKIAKCQAERDSSISSFVSLVNSKVESTIVTLKANARAYVDEQLRLYDSCWFGPEKSPDPESLCRNYTARAQAKIDQTVSLVAEMKRGGEASILQAKALADITYNKCVNK
ncbi:MAG: trypsin-like peptidase domain-containing protein [bacterium]|nr:trypsin-like peptidase domain-containing protein [bacterium]